MHVRASGRPRCVTAGREGVLVAAHSTTLIIPRTGKSRHVV